MEVERHEWWLLGREKMSWLLAYRRIRSLLEARFVDDPGRAKGYFRTASAPRSAEDDGLPDSDDPLDPDVGGDVNTLVDDSGDDDSGDGDTGDTGPPNGESDVPPNGDGRSTAGKEGKTA